MAEASLNSGIPHEIPSDEEEIEDEQQFVSLRQALEEIEMKEIDLPKFVSNRMEMGKLLSNMNPDEFEVFIKEKKKRDLEFYTKLREIYENYGDFKNIRVSVTIFDKRNQPVYTMTKMFNPPTLEWYVCVVFYRFKLATIMSTSGSKKQIGFCSKPVGESNVSDIPGLGKAAFSVLKSFGYEKVRQLLFTSSMRWLNNVFLNSGILPHWSISDIKQERSCLSELAYFWNWS